MSQPGPSSGLSQRRRGGGAGGVAHLDLDDASTSRPSSPLASPSLKHRPTASNNGSSTAGPSSSTDAPSGHRIAYDPRDLPNTDEYSHLPRLTLMEEVLLLGLKDRQGYLSFWNDSISYSLRGAILAELLLRRRLRVVRDPSRGRVDVQDRLVEVVEERGGRGKVKMTGEVLLDEALKMIRGSEEKRSVAEWIDLLSGETWNLSKIGYQLKQVRERLAKGLVDKGVLRTEKRNFLLFDMATHPVADATAKRHVLRRVTTLVSGSGGGGSGSTSSASHLTALYGQGAGDGDGDVSFAALRSLLLVCCAFAANVLDNALVHLSYEGRETAFQKVEDWLDVFGAWPMAQAVPGAGGAIGQGGAMASNGATSYSSSAAAKKSSGGGARIAEGSVVADPAEEGMGGGSSAGSSGGGGGAAFSEAGVAMGISTADLVRHIRTQEATDAGDEMLEGIAGVLAVLARMDSLL